MVTAMVIWAITAVEAIITDGAADAAITTAGPTTGTAIIIENPNGRPLSGGLLFTWAAKLKRNRW